MSTDTTLLGEPAETSVADRMYPSTKAAEPIAVDPGPAKVEPLADRLYGEPKAIEFVVPEEIKALRDTPERRFTDSPSSAALAIVKATDASLDLNEQKAYAAEVQRMADDVGLSVTELGSMHNAATSIARSYIEDPSSFAAMEVQAKAKLVEAFGDEADAALKLAQAYVARDPRVHALLAQTGLGSHPDTVVRIAQLARSRT